MRYYLTLCIVILTLHSGKAQINDRLSYSVIVDYGQDINVPSCNPFGVKISGLYDINHHLGIGAETGIMKYEKVLIPICAYGSYHFFQKKKFTPFFDASVGYGQSLVKNAIGGFHLSVGLGSDYKVSTKIKLLMSLIYQNQSLTRILKHSNEYASTEFQECLTHNSIGVKVGIVF